MTTTFSLIDRRLLPVWAEVHQVFASSLFKLETDNTKPLVHFLWRWTSELVFGLLRQMLKTSGYILSISRFESKHRIRYSVGHIERTQRTVISEMFDFSPKPFILKPHSFNNTDVQNTNFFCHTKTYYIQIYYGHSIIVSNWKKIFRVCDRKVISPNT